MMLLQTLFTSVLISLKNNVDGHDNTFFVLSVTVISEHFICIIS